MVTEAQVKTLVQDTVRCYEQLRRFCADNAGTNTAGYSITNFLAAQATLQSDAQVGDYVTELLARLSSTRTRLDGALRESAASLDSCLRMYAQVLSNVPEIDAQSILTRLYDDAITNSKRVTSRGFTFGAPSYSQVGNGSIYRLNVDENGLVLENQHADAKVARCLADASSGAAGRNEEVFELRGSQASRDALSLSGSGARVQVAALSARASTSLLQNPSFSTVGGTAAVPTSIPGWTSSITINATNYQYLDGTVGGTVSPVVQGGVVYRDYPGDSTPYALQCLANAWTLTQVIEPNRPNLSAGTPYFLQVAFKKSTAGTDGSLSLALGGVSTSISLTASPWNDTNWHTLVLCVNPASVTLGTKCWYKSFDAAGLSLQVSRKDGTTGNVTIDDIVFSPMASFDGSWYAFVGGTTQWQRYDTATWTDTENATATAQLQNWLWRSYGRYYPAAPLTPAAVVVAALAGAGAGNVDNGAHTYSYTSVDVNGVESGESPTAAVTVSDKTTNGKVTVTVPAISGVVASHNVYRSKAATTSPRYLVGNTATTSYTDNTADSSLPATQPPAGVTFAEP